MILLETGTIHIKIKDRPLLDIQNAIIKKSDRIGLVGINGSGKTTLLNFINKVETAVTIELVPQLKETITTKSGGEVTQDYINRSLAKKADILLMDEPTTNLDTRHIEKLEDQLRRYEGALVIVSHDRAFLDTICTTIWELHEGKLNIFEGNYSFYQQQKTLAIKQQEAAYEQYTAKKKQLEGALRLKEEKAKKATKKPKKTSTSEARITGAKPYFANKQKKLRQAAKAMETRLEKLEKVNKPKELPPIKMDVLDEDTLNDRHIIQFEEVAAKVSGRLLWKTRPIHVKGGEKIALIGDNGSGKTTFMKKLMKRATGITVSPAVKIGYFSQNLDILNTEQSILENVSSTSSQPETFIRTVLARLRFFREDVHKAIHVLSGGERVKVAFAKLFVSDINVLLLDEPTNFLDIESVEALESLLVDYRGTILVVSHDRQLIRRIANRIFYIEDEQIHMFEGDYEAFLKRDTTELDKNEEELLVVQTKLTEVISKLSLEPTEALEATYNSLLKRKKELET